MLNAGDNMKAIPEKRLKELIYSGEFSNFNRERNLLLTLLNNTEEIDTLTVSKLWPMCDAPKDGTRFLGYYNGVMCEYFEILKYSTKSGKLRSCSDEFNEEDVLGWIPMPSYKPEKE